MLNTLNPLQKRTLWAMADKLRSNMDAAEYKHIVLGLIFLKYISDSFSAHREALRLRFLNPDDLYYLNEDDPEAREALLARELEDRDYYTESNVFWVPEDARWETIQNAARQSDLGLTIDKALEAIEGDNPRLKGLLDKRFARTQLEAGRLGELVDVISAIGFDAGGHKASDILGQVYEYFLGEFASAEGKKGGQFYTPASVVRVLVEILAPHKGRIYDPCCGSGGMFVQSEKFVESHGGRFGDISIYGQESNPTTWRLAAMNLAIRGMDFDLGREAANSFTSDQHPDLKADFVLANPPFNDSDWWHPKLEDNVRWIYGTPSPSNANYAWLQHILHHLAPQGRAGVVLANGSMSSTQSNEGVLRRRLIEADVVECMVALPPQLFINTQIPACLWFLSRDKRGRSGERSRTGEVLFIDARKLGRLETRVRRVFDDEDITRIADTVHSWRADGETDQPYADVPGFCCAVPREKIAEHDYILTPGRYVGAEAIEDDESAFAEKMGMLVQELRKQFTQNEVLEGQIKDNLVRLGYEL